MNQHSWKRRLMGWAVIGSIGVLPVSACNGTLGTEFRSVAGASIKQGVLSIVTGLIDGMFAVIEPDSTSTPST
jgi:hypothetical protein